MDRTRGKRTPRNDHHRTNHPDVVDDGRSAGFLERYNEESRRDYHEQRNSGRDETVALLVIFTIYAGGFLIVFFLMMGKMILEAAWKSRERRPAIHQHGIMIEELNDYDDFDRRHETRTAKRRSRCGKDIDEGSDSDVDGDIDEGSGRVVDEYNNVDSGRDYDDYSNVDRGRDYDDYSNVDSVLDYDDYSNVYSGRDVDDTIDENSGSVVDHDIDFF